MVSKDICKVRGMGVAERERTSMFLEISLILSFCATPNRCSSSTAKNPSFLNLTSWLSKR